MASLRYLGTMPSRCAPVGARLASVVALDTDNSRKRLARLDLADSRGVG